MGAEYRTPVTPRNFGRVITNGTFMTYSRIRDKIIASAYENLVTMLYSDDTGIDVIQGIENFNISFDIFLKNKTATNLL